MRLYVCWSTFGSGWHPCAIAHDALVEAGYEPKVIRSYGWRFLPDVLNRTPGRRRAKQLTGSTEVPVLVTDDGEVIRESKAIAAWAREHRKATPA